MSGVKSPQGTSRIVQFVVGLIWLAGLMVAPASACFAADTSLDARIQQLSASINEHSADVLGLQEALQYPVNTRVTVFLSLETRDTLSLDSIELFLNDQPVASHLYTPRERDALAAGGVQQLYMGNLASGGQTLRAVITARSADKDFVRRESSLNFTKQAGELGLELKLSARAPAFEPRIDFVQWK